VKLWTDAFSDNAFMPKRHEFDVADFGAHGENVSPALQWSDLPADTKSLALTVYDPDAPTGSGFWHWVVVNIPVGTQGLAEDAGRADGSGLPAGALQLINDYGTRGFGGAAPPKGDKPHRYIWNLFALDGRSKLPAGASPAKVVSALNGRIIARGTLTGTFSR